MEALLGQCDAIEEYLIQRREIDLQLRKAEADQQTQETERLKKRLEQDPPVLDFPFDAKETSL
jgi:hypothetical protein